MNKQLFIDALHRMKSLIRNDRLSNQATNLYKIYPN